MENPIADEKTYTHRGVKYARVTSILRAVGLARFDAIPSSQRDYYMERGKQNHRAWELIERGEGDQYEFDPVVQAYLPAHAKFLKETGFKADEDGIEQFVSSDSLRVAGRLDRRGVMGGKKAIVDYKTTQVHPETAIQTAMYSLCLPGSFYDYERYGVAFKKTGAYQLVKFGNILDRDDALAAIRIYHLQERLHGKRD